MIEGNFAVYHLLDAHGHVLYVGMTSQIGQRVNQHRRGKPWWPEVAGIRAVFLTDYREAKRAEYRAICELRPPHNHGYPIREHIRKQATEAGRG